MALIINTNISALTAQRNLTRAQSGLERSIQRLSTGLRINGAVDDAAGLAISDRLTAQVRGLNQAVRNANDGVSALQTADGSLNEVSNLLQRARELAVQSANDSNSASDRASLQAEVSSILSELDRLSSTVQFNSRKLLDGTFQNAQFQIGANAFETVSFSISSVATADLGAKTLAGKAVSSTAITGLTSSSALTVNGISVTIGAQTSIEGVIGAINNQSGDTKATANKNAQTIVADTGFIALTTAGAVQTLTLNGVAIALSTGNADGASTFIATVNGFQQPDRRGRGDQLGGCHFHPIERRYDRIVRNHRERGRRRHRREHGVAHVQRGVHAKRRLGQDLVRGVVRDRRCAWLHDRRGQHDRDRQSHQRFEHFQRVGRTTRSRPSISVSVS